MSNYEVLHELYEQCQKINIDETFELMKKADSEEEKNFFSNVTNFILQQRQKKVIEENRF